MRGKSSSRVKAMEVMESPSSKPKEEAHLSRAYIRSLVKHLSSSRPKERTTNPRSPDSTLESPPPPPPPPHHPKKQVRRRLHTSRPYQERLLNMAEARREIVTALKFHRASMKQANEQHQPPPILDPNPSIYEANVPTFGYPHISSRGSGLLIAQDATCLESRPPLATPYHYNMWQSSTSWSYPTLTPLPDICDDLNLPLPNQPLGLNLNFHGFNNIDTPLCDSNDNKEPPMQLLSPPHSSSSSSHSYSDMKMHVAVDEKEMEEIRTIGEKHDIEWNDTMNLVTSAWWSKFMEMMEADPVEASDISTWLKDGSGGEANASHLVMKNFDEWYLQGASLPCMDIEEI